MFLETGPVAAAALLFATSETGWDPILREARAVRQSVGICDVSTLGKIDVQGRDAGGFLDRLYTNTFSTLPVGRARYGVMLREDGMVFDDGTTSRLGEHHFLMTTTTANAAAVLEHMEFHAQVAWPELDVQFCSVTDQWAQFAVAGPNARDARGDCVEGLDLGNAAFPFMARRPRRRIAGCPVRVFRVSFSGELAYEVARRPATASACGRRCWRPASRLASSLTASSPGSLRIEKGHVAGPELNGQTTARDLGLERMMKKKGDFIGRVNAERPGLMAPDRPPLVGVRAVDPALRAACAAARISWQGATQSKASAGSPASPARSSSSAGSAWPW